MPDSNLDLLISDYEIIEDLKHKTSIEHKTEGVDVMSTPSLLDYVSIEFNTSKNPNLITIKIPRHLKDLFGVKKNASYKVFMFYGIRTIKKNNKLVAVPYLGIALSKKFTGLHITKYYAKKISELEFTVKCPTLELLKVLFFDHNLNTTNTNIKGKNFKILLYKDKKHSSELHSIFTVDSNLVNPATSINSRIGGDPKIYINESMGISLTTKLETSFSGGYIQTAFLSFATSLFNINIERTHAYTTQELHNTIQSLIRKNCTKHISYSKSVRSFDSYDSKNEKAEYYESVIIQDEKGEVYIDYYTKEQYYKHLIICNYGLKERITPKRKSIGAFFKDAFNLSDSDTERMINTIKAYKNKNAFTVDILSSGISETYREKHHSSLYKSVLHNSCMRYDSCIPKTTFYDILAAEGIVKLFVMYDSLGDVYGRALLWCDNYVDRFYYSADFLIRSFVTIVNENKWKVLRIVGDMGSLGINTHSKFGICLNQNLINKLLNYTKAGKYEERDIKLTYRELFKLTENSLALQFSNIMSVDAQQTTYKTAEGAVQKISVVQTQSTSYGTLPYFDTLTCIFVVHSDIIDGVITKCYLLSYGVIEDIFSSGNNPVNTEEKLIKYLKEIIPNYEQ